MATNSSIPLPPIESFDTYNELKQSIFDQGRAIGIAYVVTKNDLRNGHRIITWNCKKYRKDRRRVINEDLRVRQRYTFREECLVSFKARERKDKIWEIVYRESRYCTHNHEAAPLGTFPEH